MGTNIPEWQGSLNTRSASASWVQLRSTTVGTVTVLADSNGQFLVTGIPSGTYTLWTAATQVGPWTQQDSNYVIQLPAKTNVASDFFASNPASLKTNFSIINAVTDFAADNTGTLDAGPAIRNALAAVPAVGGIVYLPPGTYKITSADANNNALTITLGNTKLCGAGRDATTINITRTGLTWGIAITAAQQELADLTVNFTGVTAPFWLVGMPGPPGRSAQHPMFTRITANIAAGVTIPVPPTGPPNDGVHSAVGAGIFAIGPDYPGVSSFDSGWVNFRECVAVSQTTTATTNLVSGFLIGNLTSGNVVALAAWDCEANTCTFGIQLAGGGIRWYAGGFGNNIDTDIYMSHGGGDPVFFSGVRGENGGRMIFGGDIGPVYGGLTLEDCEFDLYTPNVAIVGTAAGQVIKWNAAGALVIIGGRMGTVALNTSFGLCTNGGQLTTLVTVGLSTDVNPYPVAFPTRYKRTVLSPLIDVASLPVPGLEIHDNGVGGVYRARAFRAAAMNITSNSVPIVVPFDTVTAGDDPNGNYSTGASTYTAAVAGRYSVDVRLQCTTAAAVRAILAVYVGGTEKLRGTDMTLSSSNSTLMVNADLRLAAGDVVDVRVNILDNVAKAFDVGSALAYFDISWQGP